MAGRALLMVALAVAVSTVSMTEAATNHVVGGTTGWTIPSSASLYSQWAAGRAFVVGDTLLFNFTTGMHNVIEVPKSSYDACSAKNQIGSAITTGPATITVTAPGSHYYICGVTGHCSIGQKLAISAAPAGGSSSSTAPAPKASSAGPTPAPAPKAGSPAASAAPSSGRGRGLAPAASSSGLAPAPAAGSTGAGTLTGPLANSPSDKETPTAAAGPSGSGPSSSSAPSSSLSSGYLTSFATAALLSATAAFML